MTTWIEVFVVATVIAIALAGTPWRRVASTVGSARAAAVLAVVAVVLGAHFSPRPGEPYPATRWSMYTTSIDSMRFAEVRLLAGEVDVGPVPMPRATEPRPFLRRMLALASDAAEGAELAAQTIDETLRVLTADVDGPAPDRIVVRQCVVRAPSPEVPRRCTDVWTTMIDATTGDPR